jgi:cell division protein FtsQ
VSRTGPRRWRLVRASSTAIPTSVRRFDARARERRLRTARPWLVASVAVALAGVATFVFYGTSLFGVDQIRVTGAEFVAVADVRAAAAVATGTPLAAVDTGAVAARVRTVAGVADAEVSRDWPSTLVIHVTPRTAVAAVPDHGAYLVLDRSGVVFRLLASPPSGVVLLRVASPGPHDAATRAALTVLAALPAELRALTGEVHADAPAEIQLILTDGHVIIWGDDLENGTKARVALSLLADPGKVIDVSAPDVVTVR